MANTSARTALVTGGAGGVGSAVARRFAADGLAVAIADSDIAAAELLAKELRDGGAPATALAGDLADDRVAAALVNSTCEAFGRLDVLVCNAGTGWLAPLRDYPVDRWEYVLAVNLRASFLLAQAAASALAEHGSGAIVTVASVAATGLSGQVAYDVSKGGLITLTRSLALELGREGVRANCVAPGFTDTRMARVPAMHELAQHVIPTLPLARMAQPEEIAAAVAFLSSGDASYITGQTLFVDGGWIRQ